MSLRLLLDMNLSPEWVIELSQHGHDAVHWETIGDPRASDQSIMTWARLNGRVVFTHDLDFGTALALTHADGPSVVQVRTGGVLPSQMASVVITALRRFEAELNTGALVVVEEKRSRVRLLPL